MKGKIFTLFAISIMLMANLSASATVHQVTYNSDSGITNAKYVDTLSDGTVLGFYLYGGEMCFCGAKSTATSITVPDSLRLGSSGTFYPMCNLGSKYDNVQLDLDEATSVTSLTLPKKLNTLYASIPSQVTDLYLNSEKVPSMYYSNIIPATTTIWVPKEYYETYYSYTVNSDYKDTWLGLTVHYVGWTLNSVTIDVTTPGTLGDLLLKKVSDLSSVDEFTLTGKINTNDLKYLKMLKKVAKIDLSSTDITSITGCAGLTKLKTIVLPSTVTEIAENAFDGCYSLASFSSDKVEKIGNYSFRNCNNLVDVKMPMSTYIGSYAFYECKALKTLDFPRVTYLGSFAFEYCSKLDTVYFASVTKTDQNVFCGCYNLKYISLPSLVSLGSGVFQNCSSLKTLILGPSLESMSSEYTFYNCTLEDVYCYSVCPIYTTAFSQANLASCTLHVPAVSVNAYMLHDSWYSFGKVTAVDVDVNELNIASDFNLTSTAGIANGAALNLCNSGSYTYYNNKSYYNTGHLTVDADAPLTFGSYSQNVSNYYIYKSTLLAKSAISADNVSVNYRAQTGRWHFISLPFDVKVSDIQVADTALWVIRKYSGEDRAQLNMSSTWQNMTSDMTLKAYEGYILQCSNSTTGYIDFTFKAVNNDNKKNIFSNTDVSVVLNAYASEYAHNRSWNLVGNPYPCYFNTKGNIKHSGVITTYNNSTYTSYSLIDDNYQLVPFESFFVQCPDADNGSMTFKADGRTLEVDNMSDGYNSSRAKQSVATDVASSRTLYNVTITSGDYCDRTRVVINEAAKMDYELTCDASKFMSNNAEVPQIYVIENDEKLSIDERPLSTGTARLGIYVGETSSCTIAMNTPQSEAGSVILTDNVEGKSIDLSKDSYTFTAAKGTSDSRFTLQFGDSLTGISTVNADSDAVKAADIYTVGGQKVSAPQKGVNIINGKKVIY